MFFSSRDRESSPKSVGPSGEPERCGVSDALVMTTERRSKKQARKVKRKEDWEVVMRNHSDVRGSPMSSTEGKGERAETEAGTNESGRTGAKQRGKAGENQVGTRRAWQLAPAFRKDRWGVDASGKQQRQSEPVVHWRGTERRPSVAGSGASSDGQAVDDGRCHRASNCQ
jgi:hypothetical protein